jgi:hypothetical protein
MPNIDLSILNQRQTPAFFADTLANRPAAGFLGRIFVSTDTFAFYRDNGTGWDLIGGPGTGTITGSGAAGQVTFFNGTSSIAGDSGLTYNDVTNALTSLGTIKATNYYVGTPSDLTRSFAAKGDANTVALWLEEYGNIGAAPDIFMFKGRGTSISPSDVLVGDSTSAITTGGYVNGLLNGSTTLSTPVVNIDNTNNYANSDLVLQQTYNSITPNENFRVRAIDGYVVASNGGFETTGNINLFAGANSRRIIFDANNGVPRIFSFRTGNLPRWAFRVDGTESGSSSGSDLAIRRYDDAGTFVDAPLSINRASGQSTFAKKVVIENNTGDQQLQIVSTTAPSIRIDNSQTSATKRAGLGISTAANNFIQGSVDRDFCIFNGSTTASPMLFGIYDAGTSNTQEAARISAARNFLVGGVVDNGNKLQINGSLYTQGRIITSYTTNEVQNVVSANGNAQGSAQKRIIVRQYSVVTLGNKLIIPFNSQTNLNSTTICKVYGHSARYNNRDPLGFEINFSVGSLNLLSNLTSWGGGGNFLLVSIAGMNIEIDFITAYTSGTSDGIFVTIEYMTNNVDYSIDIANITMN